mmetsp:Transcript_11544/g.27966  ORF Transcript_11544/g.27966 Transcript_11544/m.27966 type:complete len:204 (-) Transcript_11544:601-1212(-)
MHHFHLAHPVLRNPHIPQSHDSVGVLVESIHKDGDPTSLRRPERRAHERSAAGTNHHDHQRVRKRWVVFLQVLQRQKHSLFVVDIFDRVLLEDLVRLRLQVIRERLQRDLEVVPVRLLETLGLGQLGARGVEVLEVLRVAQHVAFVPRPPRHDQVHRSREEPVQQCLVAFREDREARGVGEEDGGWQDQKLHWLGQPLLDAFF